MNISRYNDRICDTSTYGQYNGAMMVPGLSTTEATGQCLDAELGGGGAVGVIGGGGAVVVIGGR
jgi:hypothetical protein